MLVTKIFNNKLLYPIDDPIRTEDSQYEQQLKGS